MTNSTQGVRLDEYLNDFYARHAAEIEDIGSARSEARAERLMKTLCARHSMKPEARRARASKRTKRIAALAAALVLAVVPVLMFSGVIKIPGFNSASPAPKEMTQSADEYVGSGLEAAPASYEATEEAPASYAPEEAAPAESSAAPAENADMTGDALQSLAADPAIGAYIPRELPAGADLVSASFRDGGARRAELTFTLPQGMVEITVAAEGSTDADITAEPGAPLSQAELEAALKGAQGELSMGAEGVSLTVKYPPEAAGELAACILTAPGWAG